MSGLELDQTFPEGGSRRLQNQLRQHTGLFATLYPIEVLEISLMLAR